MANLVILSDEDFSKFHLVLSDPMSLVISESTYNALVDEYGEDTVDDAAGDWECGGEADSWIDWVTHPANAFFIHGDSP